MSKFLDIESLCSDLSPFIINYMFSNKLFILFIPQSLYLQYRVITIQHTSESRFKNLNKTQKHILKLLTHFKYLINVNYYY